MPISYVLCKLFSATNKQACEMKCSNPLTSNTLRGWFLFHRLLDCWRPLVSFADTRSSKTTWNQTKFDNDMSETIFVTKYIYIKKFTEMIAIRSFVIALSFTRYWCLPYSCGVTAWMQLGHLLSRGNSCKLKREFVVWCLLAASLWASPLYIKEVAWHPPTTFTKLAGYKRPQDMSCPPKPD